MPPHRPPPEALIAAIRAGDRTGLARAITLIESTSPRHRADADQVLQAVLPDSGRAVRVGISGVPGVGKSTFIEALGSLLTGRGHRVAVLAVDPSSSRSGGSILGDKTRMGRLAVDPNAFIRPSPSAGRLGGVARATRETMVLVEAAGYDIVLVETVGTGQSETVVADMVDFFLVLMLPGAGDELQGIKKGILELADMIAVNKADGDTADRARMAAQHYRSALHLLRPATPAWSVPVVTCSGLTGLGLEDLWARVLDHRDALHSSGDLAARRRQQQVRWMWSMLDDRLRAALSEDIAVRAVLDRCEAAVGRGDLAAGAAADQVLAAFFTGRGGCPTPVPDTASGR